MTELLTSDQMRVLEKAAIAGGAASGLKLMEKAGVGVVTAILRKWPTLNDGSHAALVLCGPGNNGGDGFVVARLLQDRGWDVRVFLWGSPQRLPPDARANHDRWAAQSPVSAWNLGGIQRGSRPDLIVDAVFGIGLTRPLPAEISEVLDRRMHQSWKASYDIKTVAVDCPSGLDLDTGYFPSDIDFDDEDVDPWPKFVNSADLTVTFHTPKIGHYLALGPRLCGELRIVDIGLGAEKFECSMLGTLPDPHRVRLIEPVHNGHPLPPKVWPNTMLSRASHDGHKYDHGHVIVFAGGIGRGGAGRMAARSALRSGAGLVTALCPPSALIENACQLNAVMLRSIRKDQPLIEKIDHRASAFVVGPGMGVSEHTSARVIEVLTRRGEGAAWRDPAVVLDADALGSFAQEPDILFAHTHERTILTPHEGEFERLFPDLSGPARRAISKVDAVRQAAARAGCIVLLKGSDTVIAGPDGGASVHSAAYGREAPWLATAGAGDVLAGMIAGLAAPSMSCDLFNMAEIAVYLHVEAARTFGPGLIAEDLPEQLPKVFRALGL